MSNRTWLTIRETAELLGKCEEQVRRYIRSRKHLPFTQVGRTYRIEKADVDAYLGKRVEPVA